jgi:hypothetical protein
MLHALRDCDESRSHVGCSVCTMSTREMGAIMGTTTTDASRGAAVFAPFQLQLADALMEDSLLVSAVSDCASGSPCGTSSFGSTNNALVWWPESGRRRSGTSRTLSDAQATVVSLRNNALVLLLLADWIMSTTLPCISPVSPFCVFSWVCVRFDQSHSTVRNCGTFCCCPMSAFETKKVFYLKVWTYQVPK